MPGTDPTGEGATLPLESEPHPGYGHERSMLGRGTAVGRYIVLGELGRGAMGAVYEAFDPDLERVVALKLLRRGQADTDGDLAPEGTRMLQEARAMAKLRHVNVITVYDVGVMAGSVFVAMELIRGRTLKAWVEQAKPSRRAILETFVAAGSGLAAAHDAGIVHRDFKPDNVLIDGNGRVVVLDFGLAAQSDAVVDSDDIRLADEMGSSSVGGVGRNAAHRSSSVLERLTATGSIMGTPAYMAPEQYRRRSTDPRSDQFAFCVALHEALVGKRPFSGSSLAELAAAVCRGKQDELPPEVRLPRWIADPVQRGLSVSPSDRWPDMRALMRALSRDPSRRRRWLGLGGALAVGVAGVVGIGVLNERRRVAACNDNHAALAGAWEPRQRALARDRFVEVAGEFGAGTFDRVDPVLAAQREAWLAAHSEVCKSQPPDEDLRTQCLDVARMELATRSKAFVDADRPMVELAVHFAGSADAVDRCLTDADLAHRLPTPPDARVGGQVASIRVKIAEARALRTAGMVGPAMDLAEEALDEATQTEYRPIVAEALAAVSYALEEDGKLAQAENELWKSLAQAADGGGHPSLVAENWVSLLSLVGFRQARSAEAQRWIPFIEALVRDAGSGRLSRRFENNVGVIMLTEGEHDQAESRFKRALASANEFYGKGSLQTTNYLNSLGVVRGSRGDLEGAIEYFEMVLEIRESKLGSSHPEVAVVLHNIARAKVESDPDEALRVALRCLEIRERVLPKGHARTAQTWQLVASIRRQQGDFEAAIAAAERSLQMARESFDGPHPDTERSMAILALASASLERYDRALEWAGEVVESRRRRVGDEHVQVAAALEDVMLITTRAGRYGEALVAAAELLELSRKLDSPPRTTAMALAHKAIAQDGLGSQQEAAQLVQQALAIPGLGEDLEEVRSHLADHGLTSRIGDARDVGKPSLHPGVP